MRLSELVGKQIINLYDGGKMGTVGESDLVIDLESGQIQSLILPGRTNLISFWGDQQQMVIPWEAVKKIGTEVIIVELDQTNLRTRKHLL
ncbi:MAG: YlmC/YmxH family sporulation protein [Syntrophomonadaceae bacterium]|nr:YlmC/YmxH family sporulation protein [Syntrophomonadaceae bacterium]